jgi:hypothetical protein
MVSCHIVLFALVRGREGGIVLNKGGSAIKTLHNLVASAVEVVGAKVFFVF